MSKQPPGIWTKVLILLEFQKAFKMHMQFKNLSDASCSTTQPLRKEKLWLFWCLQLGTSQNNLQTFEAKCWHFWSFRKLSKCTYSVKIFPVTAIHLIIKGWNTYIHFEHSTDFVVQILILLYFVLLNATKMD